MSNNSSNGMGIIRDVATVLFIGLGLCVLGWLAVSAWTWIFSIDPNSESRFVAFWGDWFVILFVWNGVLQGLLWEGREALRNVGEKMASDYGRVAFFASIVAVIVYVGYIIMMVFEVKEYNALHEERRGFYLTMQIVTAIIFFIVCLQCSLGLALAEKNEEKPVDNGTENK